MFKLNAPQATDEAIDDDNSFADVDPHENPPIDYPTQSEVQYDVQNHVPNTSVGQPKPPETAERGPGISRKEEIDEETRKLPVKCMIVCGVVAIVLLVGLIVAVAIALTQDNNSSSNSNKSPTIPPALNPEGGSPTLPPGATGVPTPEPQNTLGKVKKRGTLRCGVPVDQPGFALENATSGRMEGFDADLVRTVGVHGAYSCRSRVPCISSLTMRVYNA
jgi:hypothetical protein